MLERRLVAVGLETWRRPVQADLELLDHLGQFVLPLVGGVPIPLLEEADDVLDHISALGHVAVGLPLAVEALGDVQLLVLAATTSSTTTTTRPLLAVLLLPLPLLLLDGVVRMVRRRMPRGRRRRTGSSTTTAQGKVQVAVTLSLSLRPTTNAGRGRQVVGHRGASGVAIAIAIALALTVTLALVMTLAVRLGSSTAATVRAAVARRSVRGLPPLTLHLLTTRTGGATPLLLLRVHLHLHLRLATTVLLLRHRGGRGDAHPGHHGGRRAVALSWSSSHLLTLGRRRGDGGQR
mmetsp:Transcript_4003/g.9413  ORF Transcript_4003/g.9413 Transcript_4003/m.9413 type:complete len:292 (-) Transcript_4003:31-906(-)